MEADFRDGQLPLVEQLCRPAQPDGAYELRRFLPCGSLNLAVEGHPAHCEIAAELLYSVVVFIDVLCDEVYGFLQPQLFPGI